MSGSESAAEVSDLSIDRQHRPIRSDVQVYSRRERDIVHRFSPREAMKQAPYPLRPRPQPPRVSVGTTHEDNAAARRANGHHDRTRRQTCRGVYLGEK